MKTEKLNSWLSLGANVGVLIGLILLVFELRQNSDLMRAQMSQSRSDTSRAGLQATYNSDYIPAIMIKVKKQEELTLEEVFRYKMYMRSIHRNLDNTLWQFQQGLLQEDTPRVVRESIRTQLGYEPFTLETWDETKKDYSDSYVLFVEEAIADLR